MLTKAKLPAFRLYDLRHTFATQLLAQGPSITYVAAQMGHAKPTTTPAHYAHWLPRGDKHRVDALDRRAAATAEAGGSQVVAISRGVEISGGLTGGKDWSRRSDLNRRPADYETLSKGPPHNARSRNSPIR